MGFRVMRVHLYSLGCSPEAWITANFFNSFDTQVLRFAHVATNGRCWFDQCTCDIINPIPNFIQIPNKSPHIPIVRNWKSTAHTDAGRCSGY
jgi:hypothetical protein